MIINSFREKSNIKISGRISDGNIHFLHYLMDKYSDKYDFEGYLDRDGNLSYVEIKDLKGQLIMTVKKEQYLYITNDGVLHKCSEKEFQNNFERRDTWNRRDDLIFYILYFGIRIRNTVYTGSVLSIKMMTIDESWADNIRIYNRLGIFYEDKCLADIDYLDLDYSINIPDNIIRHFKSQ